MTRTPRLYRCNICECTPCESRSFCRACRTADRKRDAETRQYFDVACAAGRAHQLREWLDDSRSLEAFYEYANKQEISPEHLVEIIPARDLGQIPLEQWTDEEVLRHLAETFDLNCRAFPDIMEPYLVALADEISADEQSTIMQRGLRETIGRRLPLKQRGAA